MEAKPCFAFGDYLNKKMSRIGKKTIIIPQDTAVSLEDGLLTVKGPKGETARKFKDNVSILVSTEEKTIKLEPAKGDQFSRILWGTYASHISNMIAGVNGGFEKKLGIEGVGFKAEIKGNVLVLNVGFSHPVEIAVPDGLKVSAEKNVITVSGFDKELVGQFAAKVRSVKKPEPYKGKGIHYEGEHIRRKQGKKSA